jgi:GT2 family glycosyltransferase
VIRCAIVIVAFNCWQDVFECLDALDEQSYREFRIIIVDNGDCDEKTSSLLKHRRVELIRNHGNVGFSAANNIGIAAAGTIEFVALINPDTVPEPEWLQALITEADLRDDSAGFGSITIDYSNRGLLDGAGDAYHVTGFAWREGRGRSIASQPQLVSAREIFSPCAAAALYRTAALHEVGGFDERFFLYMEDVDLGFRLRLAGHKARLVPASRVLHRGSATTGFRSDAYVYYGQRNLVWTFVKNMPQPLFAFALAPHIVVNLAALMVNILRGRGRSAWRGKVDALRSLPAILSARRVIQDGRRVRWFALMRVLTFGWPGR